MQYSKLISLALPVAANALVVAPREAEAEADNVVYAYTTDVTVQTVVVTQTAGAPAAATETAAAAPVQYSQVHGHGHFHSSQAAAATTVVASAPEYSAPAPPVYSAPAPPVYSAPAPPVYSAPAPSAPAYSAPAPPASSPAAPASSAPASSSAGSASTGGCPADTSGQHTSPGVNGAPAKSMIDSINYLRRLYNANANCLTWSDSLASASDKCAAAQSESQLRMDSSIVSAPGYCSASYYSGKLASTEFERSMIWMLCQSPGDSELQGTCSGQTGEVGCTGAACHGHHDAIVDADNKNMYMGCGSSESTTWISCSFSNTEDYQ